MPHFALIDNNDIVQWVTYAPEGQSDADALAWLAENHPGTWVRTYYSTPGKTYAGQGYTYDPVTENFTPPNVIE